MKASRTVRAALALLSVTAVLAACETTYDEAVEQWEAANASPPGTPPGTTPPPPPPPPPGGGGFSPVFSQIQVNVFTPSCATSGCHSGAGASAGLNLDSTNSYAQLVGIASSQDAGIQRVLPGNPNNSYLIQKMEGTAAVGGVMPPGGALPQATIDIVRQWITDGAIDDRVQPSSPIRVTSLFPASGASLTAAPAQIIAGFDRDLDAATVNASTFILEASGNDGNFADGNETQIMAASISVPGVNPQTAVFDLTGVMLADDTYRVRLLGLGGSVIMDLDANALDGEFAGAFPSGNGTAGGDFQAVFTITTPVVIGPTLDQIQAVVFSTTCAGCHTGPTGVVLPSGMDLTDADASYAALVGAGGTGVPSPVNGLLRVNPGDPDTSYLIEKLEQAMPTNGSQMPLGQAPLNQTVIDEIRQWITDGALR